MNTNRETEFTLLPLLTYIIDLHDPYGTSHSQRVADMAVRLAAKHGLQPESQEVADLRLAALLHDLGKLAIPESIRRMPGLFTDGEKLIMRAHPEMGVEILDKVVNGSIGDRIKDIILSHHEDFSGKGYPQHLAGRQIPFGARVIRIVDTYDAITNVRGYATKKTGREAIDLMIDDQVQFMIFDPELFRTFLEMMKNVGDEQIEETVRPIK